MGQAVLRLRLRGQQLAQTLHRMEQPGVGACAQFDALVPHHQPIALLAQCGIVHPLQADAHARRIVCGDAQARQQFVQRAPRIGRILRRFHRHRARNPQLAGTRFHRPRQRHDMRGRSGSIGGGSRRHRRRQPTIPGRNRWPQRPPGRSAGFLA